MSNAAGLGDVRGQRRSKGIIWPIEFIIQFHAFPVNVRTTSLLFIISIIIPSYLSCIYIDISPYDGSTVTLTVKSSGANKTALDAAIAKAKALKAEDYTADSYAAVRQALVDAEAVKADV